MFEDMTGRVVVVTGASRGIGEAAARVFGEAGARVVLAARGADAISRIAEEIRGAGGAAIAEPCDVSRWTDVEALVARAMREYGRIDVMVNNAGVIEPVASLAESDPAAWSKAFEINALGVYHGMRAALPPMIEQGAGVIVNVSSGAATNPLEGWSHYCAGKAAALMLTRAGDKEAGARGVRVVGLSPGTVATRMQREIKASGVNPVSQLDWTAHIPPEWPARAILWLCGPGGADWAGRDFSLKTDEGRRAVGLA